MLFTGRYIWSESVILPVCNKLLFPWNCSTIIYLLLCQVPRDISPQKLLLVLNAFFSAEEDKNRPYLFFVNEQEIKGTGTKY